MREHIKKSLVWRGERGVSVTWKVNRYMTWKLLISWISSGLISLVSLNEMVKNP